MDGVEELRSYLCPLCVGYGSVVGSFADLDAEIGALRKARVRCEEGAQQAWGRVTRIKLPGGRTLGLYEPRHAQP